MCAHHNGIRVWDPLGDLARLVDVDRAATTLFAQHGLELPPDDPANELLDATEVLVAHAPHPVGFAALTILDQHAHLAEIAVHPAYGRKGIGSALLAQSCAWATQRGLAAITLTTFADIPWNAPWYRARGFAEFPAEHWGPEMQKQWAAEAPIMIAPRIAMIRPLS